jgi:hypothetical protein
MSKQNISLLCLSIAATAAITAERFISHAGGVPADGANVAGVARSKAAIGELVPTDVIGTAIVETGGAIAVNALIQTDVQGRAITKAAGATVARMAPGQAAATAAGQFVEVLLIVN